MGDKRAVQCEPCAVEMVKKSRLETLEEAAANLADPNICKTDNWIAGANWQAERMYSEEEIIKVLISCKDRFGGSDLDDYTHDNEVKQWFEQNKKK